MTKEVYELGEVMPWYKKSKTNLSVLILLSILIVTVLFLIITLVVILQEKNKNGSICFTPACIHIASRIINNMDNSIDPCNDFYQFACGNYVKNKKLPEDKIIIRAFSTISDTIQDQLKLIIDDLQLKDVKKPYSMIKDLCNICMNTTAIENQGLPVLEEILNELGGWPILEGDNWNETKFDWKDIMYKSRKLGLPSSRFIEFTVGVDRKNTSRRMIYLDQAKLSLSREYLIKGLDDNAVKDHYNKMVEIAVLLGANSSTSMEEFNKTVEFEINLAKICLPREQRRNASNLYNPMSVKELQTRYPFIPWLEYLTTILDVTEIKISEDEIVNVVVPQYLTDLNFLLHHTPKRTQANYVMAEIVLSSVYSLPKRFRDRSEEFSQSHNRRKVQQPRWKECVSVASESIPLAMNALYIRKYFNEEAKNNAKQMVKDIHQEFLKTLKTNNWMDEATRQEAIEKANSMFTYVGYPDELLDDKNIEEYDSNLEINIDSYLKAMLAISRFNQDQKFKQLREPVNRSDWRKLTLPTTINAVYNFQMNTIEFPAGILQDVLFSKDRPHYMNYGGIGSIIGHEITHGFDDHGRQYDKNGNIAEWWTKETEKIFIRKAQCIIEQYGNYSVPKVGLSINGVLTQGENIADNGGLKHAYLGYQAFVKRNGPEKRLPGLPYTPNQLFWVSSANVWCTKSRDQYLNFLLRVGNHSPGKYRVLGPFSNTEYFSKDFNCPLGSKMNPVRKCQVW